VKSTEFKPIMDLALLVADSMIEFAVRGVLGRRASLRIRPVTFSSWTHPERDPGCRLRAHEFLRPFSSSFSHALVVFDRDGSGSDESREALELEVGTRLAASGWNDRASVVVIAPELEAWVWSDSPAVPSILGWESQGADMRDWLTRAGFWPDGEVKPSEPKAALSAVLREVRQPHSASLFRELAEQVSLIRCADPAFAKLRSTLTAWFPADG